MGSETMSIHPVFREALAPFAPPAPKPMRLFAVNIMSGAAPEEIRIMAQTSSDAIRMVLGIYMDGDEDMPLDGLTVSVRPIYPPEAA